MGVWKSMKRYFRHHPFVLILCIISILIFTLLSLTPPMIMRYFIDYALDKKDRDLILMLALMYFGSYIVMNIFNFARYELLAVISQGISKQIRLDMLQKVNRLDYVSFTRFDAGTLEAYFSNDVDSIDALITSGVVSFVTDLFKIIGILIEEIKKNKFNEDKGINTIFGLIKIKIY